MPDAPALGHWVKDQTNYKKSNHSVRHVIKDPKICNISGHCVWNNVGIWGGDFYPTSISSGSIEDCQESCDSHDQCFAFSYNKNINVCYLKHENYTYITDNVQFDVGFKFCGEMPKTNFLRLDPSHLCSVLT